MATVTDLKDFIAYAQKNRKYPSNTAQGRRAALKMFELELNDDEKQSIELIGQRFEAIYNTVYQKHKNALSPSSWITYKKRMRTLLRDYVQYANDPTLFNAWQTGRAMPTTAKKAQKANTSVPVSEELKVISVPTEERPVSTNSLLATDLNKVEYFLRPGFRVTLVLPNDFKAGEASRLKRLIDGMVVEDEPTRV